MNGSGVIGGDRLMRRLRRMPDQVKDHVDRMTAKSGDELVATAKILIPVESGEAKSEIHGEQRADGSYLADFGPKSKVIEGESGPRPFVNPALKVLRKKHRARARRAMNKAVKEVFSGGS